MVSARTETVWSGALRCIYIYHRSVHFSLPQAQDCSFYTFSNQRTVSVDHSSSLLPIMIVIWLVKMLCCSLSVGQPVVCCTCDRLLLPHQHQPDLVLYIRVSLHSTAFSSLLSPLSSLLFLYYQKFAHIVHSKN